MGLPARVTKHYVLTLPRFSRRGALTPQTCSYSREFLTCQNKPHTIRQFAWSKRLSLFCGREVTDFGKRGMERLNAIARTGALSSLPARLSTQFRGDRKNLFQLNQLRALTA